MRLTFHGGAGSVTGANYLLDAGGEKILIDCGLLQGSHFAERQNFEPFPYDPSAIRAVIITHAHLDHVGRLPRLYEGGFRGIIFSTAPTKDFAELILLDSEHILMKEAEREGKPPLTSPESIQGVMGLWKVVDYHAPFMVGPFKVELYDAGHILGSSMVKIDAERNTVVFSGDLGNYPAPMIRSTEQFTRADYCVIESTYGDRAHGETEERREELENVIEDTAKQGGVLMIPAFAMERTQELLYHLHELFEQGRIPPLPVYIDSPLAIKMTQVYRRYRSFLNKESAAHVRERDDILHFPNLHFTPTTEESKKINDVPPPKIIIAGSGMSQGGRILHHERRYLSDQKSTILFVGFQSHGSLGRRILEGAKTVTLFGEEVPVRCRVRSIPAYSAHADQPRLLQWITPLRTSLKRVFVVQGEEESAGVLAQKLRDTLALSAHIPKAGETVVLE
ncbi:MAG: hypothetical protein RIQ56_111 [Candidatus Parcubacteria bacterium]|jgi:metallo-beta-lactamase family protein